MRAHPVLLRFLLAAVLLLHLVSLAGRAASAESGSVEDEEYAVFDRVIDAKFLTSETPLVLIRRTTATHVGPSEQTFTRRFFEENEFFEGQLPPPLLADFLLKAVTPVTLQPRFAFGVRYRLVTSFEGGGLEETVLSLPADPRVQFIPLMPGPLMLELSRVAFGPRREQALLYVGNYRLDGTGAGFLVWLKRGEDRWEIRGTEVIWTAVPGQDR